MENLNNTVPKTIIIEPERKRFDEKLRKALRVAHDAFNSLRQLEDLGEIPEPHECTAEWLDRITAAKKEAVNKADFLTAEQKKSQIAHWGRYIKKARGYVEIINNFIASIPEGQYIYDGEIGIFYIKDIFSLVNSRCTRNVPAEAETHWQLIQKVRSAIDELRDWEKGMDLRKFRLEELFSMTPEQIAAQWATGNIKVVHTYDHLPNIILTRELHEKGYL